MAISCGGGSEIRFSLSSGSTPYTLGFFFRVPDTTSKHWLLAKGSEPNLYADGTSSDRLLAEDTNPTQLYSTTSFSANTWHHAAYYRPTGASAASLWLDGAGKNTGVISDAAQTGIVLGQGTCDLAELAWWNVELTDAEVALLAAGFSPQFIRPQSLVHYFPLVRAVQDVRRSTSVTESGGSVIEHPRVFYRRARHAFHAEAPNEVVRSAINVLQLSQSSAPSELALSVASSLVLSQSSFPPFNEQSVTQTLTLSQEEEYNNNAQNALALTQQAYSPEVLRTIEQTLRLRHTLRAVTGNLASGRYRR